MGVLKDLDTRYSATEPAGDAWRIPAEDLPPIFADATGRRRRRLRWAGFAVAVACVVYAAVLVISVAGVSITPQAVRPEGAPASSTTAGGHP